MSAIPFKIEIPTEKIERLKQKLALSDLPNDIGETDNVWSKGPPVAEIRRLANYWQDSFDFQNMTTELNRIPQYTMPVEVENHGTYDLHFIHQKSNTANAIPLLFLHGWPGSFIEVTKILPGLTNGDGDEHPAFHVVAPSLIDFGFSSGSHGHTAFKLDHHAEAYHYLMQKLGYEEYVIQGGDVGNLISRFMAASYGPKHVKAYHNNSASPGKPDPTLHPDLHAKMQATPLTPAELAGLGRAAQFQKEGMGYYSLQSSKPLTTAYCLRDPIALLAWITEKLHIWSDNYPWTPDEILTWVSIYYFSRAGPEASSNVYYAMEHPLECENAFVASQKYIDVPLGITRLSNDFILLPRLWNQTLGPVVFEAEHDGGGHFAAWERPNFIIGDLRSMFGRGGGAFGCVNGKSGYADE